VRQSQVKLWNFLNAELLTHGKGSPPKLLLQFSICSRFLALAPRLQPRFIKNSRFLLGQIWRNLSQAADWRWLTELDQRQPSELRRRWNTGSKTGLEDSTFNY